MRKKPRVLYGPDGEPLSPDAGQRAIDALHDEHEAIIRRLLHRVYVVVGPSVARGLSDV